MNDQHRHAARQKLLREDRELQINAVADFPLLVHNLARVLRRLLDNEMDYLKQNKIEQFKDTTEQYERLIKNVFLETFGIEMISQPVDEETDDIQAAFDDLRKEADDDRLLVDFLVAIKDLADRIDEGKVSGRRSRGEA